MTADKILLIRQLNVHVGSGYLPKVVTSGVRKRKGLPATGKNFRWPARTSGIPKYTILLQIWYLLVHNKYLLCTFYILYVYVIMYMFMNSLSVRVSRTKNNFFCVETKFVLVSSGHISDRKKKKLFSSLFHSLHFKCQARFWCQDSVYFLVSVHKEIFWSQGLIYFWRSKNALLQKKNRVGDRSNKPWSGPWLIQYSTLLSLSCHVVLNLPLAPSYV